MAYLTTRFGDHRSADGSCAITLDRMRELAPSVFAESAHESRSQRYAYIPTVEVINGLIGEGWAPVFACQSKTRKEGHKEYTKHMIRLRRQDDLQIRTPDSNDIIVINSHNGSSGYQMLGGAFRSGVHE